MTPLLVDASALVAIMTREPDDEVLARTMSGFATRICSSIAVWEATVAIARKRWIAIHEAQTFVAEFVTRFVTGMVPIGPAEADAALSAWARYGKMERGAVKLNMGDCFAYACAKTNKARLLYKGDDFIHTDLR